MRIIKCAGAVVKDLADILETDTSVCRFSSVKQATRSSNRVATHSRAMAPLRGSRDTTLLLLSRHTEDSLSRVTTASPSRSLFTSNSHSKTKAVQAAALLVALAVLVCSLVAVLRTSV
jgi:hypothetical protein